MKLYLGAKTLGCFTDTDIDFVDIQAPQDVGEACAIYAQASPTFFHGSKKSGIYEIA